jgi:hypothetical protein
VKTGVTGINVSVCNRELLIIRLSSYRWFYLHPYSTSTPNCVFMVNADEPQAV